MKLHLWKDQLWGIKGSEVITYCPEHRIELEVKTVWGTKSQFYAKNLDDRRIVGTLVCPTDEKEFDIVSGSLDSASRRFLSTLESIQLKDAEIVSIDGYQIPIVKTDTPSKDETYWVQARINDTKQGKQVVVYAGKRGEKDKSQIFIDVENDKISFDQNNIHPNDIFFKLTGQFKSGRKATLEENTKEE